MALAGIVLSAGSSVRMGMPKALLAYRGETFLSLVLRRLREAGVLDVVVVLGEHAAAIRQAVDLSGARVVVNPDPGRGMFSSVRLGAAAAGGPALLCLVDQPQLQPETYAALAPQPGPLQARLASFRGSTGHPVALGAELVARLPGAAEPTLEVFLAAHAERVAVETLDPAVLQNVNTPEAYERLGP